MTLQNSPGFEGDSGQRIWYKLLRFLSRYSKLALTITGLFFLIILIMMVLFASVLNASQAGGLDGCLIDTLNQPVAAQLQIEKQSLSTFEDGCFFFSSLEPGTHILIITTNYDQVLEIPVEIFSGQAVNLGNKTIYP